MGEVRSVQGSVKRRGRTARRLAMLIQRGADRYERDTDTAPSAADDQATGMPARFDRWTTETLVREFISEHILAAGRQPNEYQEVDGHVAAILKAARSRGLEVIKAGDGRFFYRDGVPIGGLRRMVTTMVGSIAVASCASKHVTRGLLTNAGVPIPRGADFGVNELAAAQKYVRTLARPVAIKPTRGSGGGGISVGVLSPSDVEAAWATATGAGGKHGRIVVEEQITGLDVRAFVVGGRVVAASVRVPAYVIGDGRSSISALIRRKQARRLTNTYLSRGVITADEQHLRGQGRSQDSVPQRSEVVVLGRVANIHRGGENIDVTRMISSELKDLAVRAARAIPGLHVAGVDLMVPALDQPDGAVVLEANTSANIAMHHAPAYGEPVDVAGAIVDEMLEQHRN